MKLLKSIKEFFFGRETAPSYFEIVYYRDRPLYKRPWESIVDYHIRVGEWRGDSSEYIARMIEGSLKKRDIL